MATLLLAVLVPAVHAQSSNPAELYKEALAREAPLRAEMEALLPGGSAAPLLRRIRILVGAFEDLARLFPDSDQGDQALWQGGSLAADAFARFGENSDLALSVRLMRALVARFPKSPLASRATAQLARLQQQPSPVATPPVVAAAAEAPLPVPADAPAIRAAAPPPALPPGADAVPANAPPTGTLSRPTAPTAPARTSAPSPAPVPVAPPPALPSGPATVRAIRREVLADAVRITIELDREVWFYHERLDNPPRVFVDLQGARTVEALRDATIPATGDLLKQIRVGRHANARTRVVFDLASETPYSVYSLYNPYRVVVDFERDTRAPQPRAAAPLPPAAADVAPAAAAAPPLPAAANSNGTFSLARQLGLRVTRIALDPGHGGHDPGARANSLSESELVLDIALRLEKLLQKERDVEVVLTRRTDEYVPLEERTAIANDSEADLFLSIHVNASDAASARGIETYFLNFAPNKEAEAIAARENAGSSRSMRELPDLVQAITMNNKLDESRDFARTVQSTLYDRLRGVNRSLKNLGVKQAPFMVLIGARMPSALAEISFMSNRQEATLLKTDRYRQQIAEALLAGIMRYQEALNKNPAVATK